MRVCSGVGLSYWNRGGRERYKEKWYLEGHIEKREKNNFLLYLWAASICIEGQLKQINLTTKEKLLSHQINLILLNLTLKQIFSILNLTVGGNN